MFKVLSKSGSVVLSARQVADMLVAKSIDPKAKKSQEAAVPLASALAQELEDKGLMKETSPIKLLALGIGVGYYLNTFFRKNEVEIEEQKDASERTREFNRETPSDTGSSSKASN